jgi:hypothetical protein
LDARRQDTNARAAPRRDDETENLEFRQWPSRAACRRLTGVSTHHTSGGGGGDDDSNERWGFFFLFLLAAA